MEGQQIGAGPGQPAQVVLPDPRAEVEQERGDRTGARLDAGLHDRLELLGESESPGSTGATSTPHGTPAALAGHRLHPPAGGGACPAR